MKKAFTLIELVVAVALFAIVFAFAGVIFKVSINSYRVACANAEIIQKLRAITDQLDTDFRGLRKDGEIFVIWKEDPVSQERFDRIMFFADGDFQSYETYNNGIRDPGGEPVHGSVARICYMLANKPDNPNPPIRPPDQDPQKRILARTQHILTADPQFINAPLTPNGTTSAPSDWYYWNDVNEYDYDMNSLDKWENIPWTNKQDMLTVITDVNVGTSSIISLNISGTMVDPTDADLIHNIFCEGVGEFEVQGWYDAQQRWVPEWENGDFYPVGSINVPGVLYPYRAWLQLPPNSYVEINGINNYSDQLVDGAHFNDIPGLGRALKFTFTLYDSKGVFKQGRTFTHIVYIGN
jgi:prepilin-type N-terminal cleavage/methylation domain-containing protein